MHRRRSPAGFCRIGESVGWWLDQVHHALTGAVFGHLRSVVCPNVLQLAFATLDSWASWDKRSRPRMDSARYAFLRRHLLCVSGEPSRNSTMEFRLTGVRVGARACVLAVCLADRPYPGRGCKSVEGNKARARSTQMHSKAAKVRGFALLTPQGLLRPPAPRSPSPHPWRSLLRWRGLVKC